MIIKLLFFFVLFLICLNASVKLDAPKSVASGDVLAFTLEASGQNVEFPKIDTIGGYSVQTSITSKNITIINAQRTETVSKQFLLFPNADITLPSFKIMVDGKPFFTQEKTIQVIKARKTLNDNFDFTIQSSKKSLYVGESVLVTFEFKHKNNLQIVDLNLITPNFSNFWAKQIGQAQTISGDVFTTEILKYVLFPQKSGALSIPSARIDVALLDDSQNRYSMFGTPTKIEKIYSNELPFDVKALPQGISIVGDFTIQEQLSSTAPNAGDAVIYNVEINGCGNIDDLEDIKLNIANATIYDNPAQKSFKIINDNYCGSYKKSFSIVANESYDIDSLGISYFDLKDKSVKTLKTKAYHVTIENSDSESLKLEKETVQESPTTVSQKQVVIDKSSHILFFLYGILSCIFLFLLVKLFTYKNEKRKRVEKPISQRIKATKNTNDLIKLLIPYVHLNKDLDAIIFELEKNCDCNLKIKKKEIIKIIESLN